MLWVTVECNPHPHLLRVSPLVLQEVLGTLALAVVAGIIGYRAYLGSLSPGVEDLFGIDWVEHYRSYGRCRFDVFYFPFVHELLQDMYPQLYLALNM